MCNQASILEMDELFKNLLKNPESAFLGQEVQEEKEKDSDEETKTMLRVDEYVADEWNPSLTKEDHWQREQTDFILFGYQKKQGLHSTQI